jgi:hypothetical protein
MSHTLKLYDGTTTISLSTTNAWLIRYTPGTPKIDDTGMYQKVTESVELQLYAASTSALQTFIQSIQRMLEAMRRRQVTRTKARVWLLFQPDGDAVEWRSEIVDARLVLGNDSLKLWASNTVEAQLTLTRQPYWEGARTAIQCSTSKDTSPVTTEVRVYSNDDATATDTNYLNIASTQITGDLPAPLELAIRFPVGGLSAPEIWLTNLVHGVPCTMDPFLLGTEADNGAAASWNAGETTQKWSWKMVAAQLAACAGQNFHVLVAFSSKPTSTAYVRLKVCAYVDPGSQVYIPIHTGPWVKVTDALMNIGSAPIPPGGYDEAAGATALAIDVLDTGSNSGTIDFIQLTAAGEGLYRMIDQVGFLTEVDDKFIDKPVEELLYVAEVGGAHQPILVSRQSPIFVWPGLQNRLRILMSEGGTFTAARLLYVQAWYRPRRILV